MEFFWIVPLIPLCNALILGLVGHRINQKKIVICTATAFAFCAFLFAAVLKTLIDEKTANFTLQPTFFTWIESGGLTIEAGFRFTPVSSLLAALIAGIASLVTLHPASIQKDIRTSLSRHTILSNLFIFALFLTLLGNSYITFLAGWQGCFLFCYLMAHESGSSNAPAPSRRNVTLNKIGDLALIIAIILMLASFKSTDFKEITSTISLINSEEYIVSSVALLLLFSVSVKSGQLPFHCWMPNVIKSCHSINLFPQLLFLTSGAVFFLIQSKAIFIQSLVTMNSLSLLGLITAILMAFFTLLQSEIKNALTYSLMSHTGYIFLLCGIGSFEVAFLFLITIILLYTSLYLLEDNCTATMDQQTLHETNKKPLHFVHMPLILSVLLLAALFPIILNTLPDKSSLHLFPGGLTIFFLLTGLSFFTTSASLAKILLLFLRMKKQNTTPKNRTTLPSLILTMVGGFVVAYPIGVPEIFDFFSPTTLSPLTQVDSTMHLAPPKMLPQETLLISFALPCIGFLSSCLLQLYPSFILGPFEDKTKTALLFLKERQDFDPVAILFTIRIQNFVKIFLWKIVDVLVINGLVNDIGNFFLESGNFVQKLHSGAIREYAFVFIFISCAVMTFYLLQ